METLFGVDIVDASTHNAIEQIPSLDWYRPVLDIILDGSTIN